MSYQQCTRFQSRISLKWINQYTSESGVTVIRDFPTFNESKLVNFGPLTKKWTWPLSLKFNSVLKWSRYMFMQKFHQAECSGSWVIMSTTFLSYFAMVKNPKNRSLTFNLWPWNSLGFERLSKNMFTQNFMELSASVHELSRSHTQREKTPDESNTVCQ